MALEDNVKLVIEMPKIEYEHLTNEEKFSSLDKSKRKWLINKTLNRIADGIQLPEGCGKIIDADTVIAEAKEKMKYPSNHKYMECVIATMNLAPPIIKPDKAIDADPAPKEHKEKRLTNKKWIDFLSEQFDVSRTSAKEMLHIMMSVKERDNFKKQLNESAKTKDMDEAMQEEEEER